MPVCFILSYRGPGNPIVGFLDRVNGNQYRFGSHRHVWDGLQKIIAASCLATIQSLSENLHWWTSANKRAHQCYSPSGWTNTATVCSQRKIPFAAGLLMAWGTHTGLASNPHTGQRWHKPDGCSEHHTEVFKEGLGSMKNITVKLNIKPDSRPKFFKARPVPYAIKPKVETELEYLLKKGVLEPVSQLDSLQLCWSWKRMSPWWCVEISKWTLTRYWKLNSTLCFTLKICLLAWLAERNSAKLTSTKPTSRCMRMRSQDSCSP